MVEAMPIESAFKIAEAIAVTIGVVFAIAEWHQHKKRQLRESALELLHSSNHPPFAKALLLVYALPDEGLSKQQIEDRLGPELHLVYALTTTWESLGVLVHRREIDLALVSEFFSGPIRISWRKLRNYYIEEWALQQRETIGEWFQWLAERLGASEVVSDRVPAHVAHRNWTP
jgi:hypothetical protein